MAGRSRGAKAFGQKWTDLNYDAKVKARADNGGQLPDTPALRNSAFPHDDEWSRDNLPEILFYIVPPESRYKNLRANYLMENGKAVESDSGRKIKDFEILPRRISLEVEGWLVEAWRRIDPRITYQDIIDRQQEDPDFGGIGLKKLTKNALQNHCRRACRKVLNNWVEYARRDESHRTEVEAIEGLSYENIAFNTVLRRCPTSSSRLVKVALERLTSEGLYYAKPLIVTEGNVMKTTYDITYFVHSKIPEGFNGSHMTERMIAAWGMFLMLQERAGLHGKEHWSKLDKRCLPVTWFDRTREKSIANPTYDGGCASCTWKPNSDRSPALINSVRATTTRKRKTLSLPESSKEDIVPDKIQKRVRIGDVGDQFQASRDIDKQDKEQDQLGNASEEQSQADGPSLNAVPLTPLIPSGRSGQIPFCRCAHKNATGYCTPNCKLPTVRREIIDGDHYAKEDDNKAILCLGSDYSWSSHKVDDRLQKSALASSYADNLNGHAQYTRCKMSRSLRTDRLPTARLFYEGCAVQSFGFRPSTEHTDQVCQRVFPLDTQTAFEGGLPLQNICMSGSGSSFHSSNEYSWNRRQMPSHLLADPSRFWLSALRSPVDDMPTSMNTDDTFESSPTEPILSFCSDISGSTAETSLYDGTPVREGENELPPNQTGSPAEDMFLSPRGTFYPQVQNVSMAGQQDRRRSLQYSSASQYRSPFNVGTSMCRRNHGGFTQRKLGGAAGLFPCFSDPLDTTLRLYPGAPFLPLENVDQTKEQVSIPIAASFVEENTAQSRAPDASSTVTYAAEISFEQLLGSDALIDEYPNLRSNEDFSANRQSKGGNIKHEDESQGVDDIARQTPPLLEED